MKWHFTAICPAAREIEGSGKLDSVLAANENNLGVSFKTLAESV